MPLGRFLSTPSARRATLPQPLRLTIMPAFLSTPSARRATRTGRSQCTPYHHFYPRPPRGGRPVDDRRRSAQFRFLSTPSARRATIHLSSTAFTFMISIHALREEGDVIWENVPGALSSFLSTPSARRATRRQLVRQGKQSHFYPRPPRGGRRAEWATLPSGSVFLSTPSARRAT